MCTDWFRWFVWQLLVVLILLVVRFGSGLGWYLLFRCAVVRVLLLWLVLLCCFGWLV